MKKVRIIVISVVLLIVVIGAGILFMVLSSPEYALARIASDVKESGIDGLKPHLTGDAQATLDKVSSVSENKIIGAILSLLDKSDYVGVLKSEIDKVEWGMEDITKSRKRANVYLSFDYENKLTGTIEITMTRENREWKISDIGWPDFEKINFF